VTTITDYEKAEGQELLDTVDVVLIAPPKNDAPSKPTQPLRRLLSTLESKSIATMIMGETLPGWFPDSTSLVMTVPSTISDRELWGRLETMSRYGGLINRMDRELNNMQTLGKKLNQHFAQIDQEMRLARRLQQDFLPKSIPQTGPAKFHTVFRPADWVSGDIFDVFQLDEDHVGFYVADAVGHGLAAGLLTMFIKQALPTKEIKNWGYRLITPEEAMAALNQSICEQHLPNAQFVTACYCVLNLRTLEMCFSRGGHPYPALATADGHLSDLKAEGSLLGIFPNETFPMKRVQLNPGDKILLYSDGLELALVKEQDDDSDPNEYRYQGEFRRLAGASGERIAAEFTQMMDDEAGSLNPTDDVTIVVLEIDANASIAQA
jgi:sigma-B regulation protein RsbU (phosphoserine phosphatase)